MHTNDIQQLFTDLKQADVSLPKYQRQLRHQVLAQHGISPGRRYTRGKRGWAVLPVCGLHLSRRTVTIGLTIAVALIVGLGLFVALPSAHRDPANKLIAQAHSPMAGLPPISAPTDCTNIDVCSQQSSSVVRSPTASPSSTAAVSANPQTVPPATNASPTTPVNPQDSEHAPAVPPAAVIVPSGVSISTPAASVGVKLGQHGPEITVGVSRAEAAKNGLSNPGLHLGVSGH